jgi:hypothetical protein
MESYTSQNQGSAVALELIEAHPSPSLTFYEKDEPLCIHILRSGWSKPQLYHVLVEFGDRMETTVHLLEASQIEDMFGIDIDKSFENTPLVFRKETIKKLGNDMELGKHVRGTLNK